MEKARPGGRERLEVLVPERREEEEEGDELREEGTVRL